MPIEPLRCKVCGGLLDDKLKCQHCGTLHERVENRLEIIKVCPKHLIGYSSLYCPKCAEEREAKEQLEKARRVQEQVEREDRHRRIKQVRAEHQQWKKNNYPKLKKMSAVALLCLIIGIAGLCVTAKVYMSSNVYKPSTKGTNPPFVTIISSSNGMRFGYGDTCFSVGLDSNYFTANVYLNSNLIGSYVSAFSGEPYQYADIPFSVLNNSDTYAISIGAPPAWTGSTVNENAGESCTFTYTSSSTYPIAALPYTFGQAVNVVSTSAIGITEILLIVMSALILVAIPIVVYSKSCYELE